MLAGDLAQTRSYSRWQAAQIGRCGCGAVCDTLTDLIKIFNCPLVVCTANLSVAFTLLSERARTAGKIKSKILVGATYLEGGYTIIPEINAWLK